MNKMRCMLSIGLAALAAVATATGITLLLGWAIAARAAPAGSIQSMIDAAPDGGTVNIPAGTYNESLTVNKTITLTGVSSATTIIHAVTGQRVITVTSGHTLRLENLTLTGGQTGNDGGGVYVDGSLQIVNCLIADNSARFGGGVYQWNTGRVDIIGSRIERNQASADGGGLYINGDAALTNTLVLTNTASRHGGGLHVITGRADVLGGRFAGNRAVSGNGGGISLNKAINVSGTQIISNTAGGDGGGLLQWDSGQPVNVTNARFERNTASLRGGGLFINGNVALINTLVLTNTANADGGGLMDWAGSTNLTGGMFAANSAGTSGGGVSANNSVSISGTQFINNTARQRGGGLLQWNAGYTVTVVNARFERNRADQGGGLWVHGNATATNVVVMDNVADDYGSGTLLEGSVSRFLQTTIARNVGNGSGILIINDGATYSTLALTNTILVSQTVGIMATAGNTATLNGVLWFGNGANTGGAGYVIVQNATTGNPAFAADGYHLTAASIAIDHGVNAGVTTDIDGEPRPMGAGYDLGADEFRFRVYLPLVLRQ